MRTGILISLALASLILSSAHAAEPKGDVFKGKLFAPDIILGHQAELHLTKQQTADIRTAVIAVQTGVAEHEWDMREAYQSLMAELDRSPIDESAVLGYVNSALLAENQVKKKQVSMLVRLRNILTAEQVTYLESLAENK